MPDQLPQGERLHFRNPPIIEAVIAFRMVPLQESALAAIKACAPQMRSLGYPHSSPVLNHQFQIRVDQGVASGEHEATPSGIKFTSEDYLHAVQFNRTEFVFSRLGRYDSWEPFRDEAKRLWRTYQQVTGGSKVVLVDVRYINKVFFPATADSAEYLNARPLMPREIAPQFHEVFMRVVAPITEPPGNFIHNQVLVPSEREGFAAVLVDNDFQFPTSEMADVDRWAMLETVRDIKDRYFVAVTTKKLRDTFDA